MAPDPIDKHGIALELFSKSYIPLKPVTYDEAYPILEKIVEKSRGKWKLNAVPSYDFDDAKFVILNHIFKKWHLYDQTKSLLNWTNSVVRAQLINIFKNLYMSISKPCSHCPLKANLEDQGIVNGCAIYGEQSSACPYYAKWEKSKRFVHDAKLPVTIEDHLTEVYSKPNERFSIDTNFVKFHKTISGFLSEKEWKVYKMSYIDNLEQDEVANAMGYKITESGNKNGYRRLRQIESSIVTKAKKIIADYGWEEFI